MSRSEPKRIFVAWPAELSENKTLCPWRNMRNIEPSRASAAMLYSLKSVSLMTMPSPDDGSNALITPCTPRKILADRGYLLVVGASRLHWPVA